MNTTNNLDDLSQQPAVQGGGLLTKAAELKPMTVAPSATTPAGMTQQNAGTVNTAGGSYTPTAYTQDVDPSKTTAGLLSQAMDKNGELMRIASQRGYNMANRRGMGNSSIASQASMGAMIDAAMPIAQSDASIYQQQAASNQAAMNSAASATNEMQAADMRTRQEAELKRVTDLISRNAIGEEYRNRMIQQYMADVSSALNDKTKTPAQLQAYMDRSFEMLQTTIGLQASLEGVDFSKYKPGGATGGSTSTSDAVNAAFGNNPNLDQQRATALRGKLVELNKSGSRGASPVGRGASPVGRGVSSVSRQLMPLDAKAAETFMTSLSPEERAWIADHRNEEVAKGMTIGTLLKNATEMV